MSVQYFYISPGQKRVWKLRHQQGPVLHAFTENVDVKIEHALQSLSESVTQYEFLTFAFAPRTDLIYPLTFKTSIVEQRHVVRCERRLREFDRSVAAAHVTTLLNDQQPPFVIHLFEASDRRTDILFSFSPITADFPSINRFANSVIDFLLGSATASDDEFSFLKYGQWHNDLLEGVIPREAPWRDFRHTDHILLPAFGSESSTPACYDGTVYSLGTLAERRLGEFEPEAVLLSCFVTLLHLQSDVSNFNVGYVSHRREYEELEKSFGPYSKTLAMPVTEQTWTSKHQILRSVSSSLEGLKSWQEYFNPVEGDGAVSTFRYCFEFIDITHPTGGRLSYVGVPEDADVFLQCQRDGDKVLLRWYSGTRFAPTELSKVNELYSRLFDSFTSGDLNVSASKLSEVAVPQQRFARPTLDILHKFQGVVARYPEKLAARCAGNSVTYMELDAMSERIASGLTARGAKPGDPVAIVAPRGIASVAAMLGVLKAGCCFVPFEENHKVRTLSGIRDSTCKFVLSSNPTRGLEPDVVNLMIERLDGPPRSTSKPPSIAYVIYTSGSTGTPKGVAIEQHSLVNYVEWLNEFVGISDSDTCLLATSNSFDLGFTSLWGAILNGGTLEIFPEDVQWDPNVVLNLIHERAVTVLKLTPALFGLLVRSDSDAYPLMKSVRVVLVGGEKMDKQDVQNFMSRYPLAVVYNHYGPTEATIGAIACRVTADILARYPRCTVIGRPISNMQAIVASPGNEPLAVGFSGELLLAGTGLAHGYWNNQAATDSKFVFINGTRYYKTGDVARLTTSGHVEFIGRSDRQIKINGYRVELNEIEYWIKSISGVDNAAVVVRWDCDSPMVVAYAQTRMTASLVQNELLKLVPAYMAPGLIVTITEFPINANGKIDLSALPSPEKHSRPFVAPRNELEILVAQAWSDVLSVQRVSVNDNFYELGGDSIKAIQVASWLQKRQLSLALKDMLSFPTVEDIARRIGRSTSDESFTGVLDLLPAQERFFRSLTEGAERYAQSFLFHLPGIDPAELNAVLNKLLEYHDSLRASFEMEDARWIQTVTPFREIGIDDWRVVGENEWSVELEEALNSLSLSGPLFRFKARVVGDRAELLVVIHHLVVDGVSWRIFMEDLNDLIAQSARHEPLSLPMRTCSLARWVEELKAYPATAAGSDEIHYWEQLLSDIPVGDLFRGTRMDFQSAEFAIEAEDVLSISHSLKKSGGGSVETLLLSSFCVCYARVFKQDRVVIEMESHGREFKDLNVSRTMGWFTSFYPLVVDMRSASTVKEVLDLVRTEFSRIAHKGLGFDVLKVSSRILKNVTLNVRLNYLGEFSSKPGTTIKTLGLDSTGKEVKIFKYGLDVSGITLDGKLLIRTDIDSTCGAAGRLQEFATQWKEELLNLRTDLETSDELHKFTFGQMSPDDLSVFLSND